MANGYVVNQRPFRSGTLSSTYGEALSLLVEMLVTAGWTYQASGDGLAAFNGSGKVFTTVGTGATGWNNGRAWARVQDPAGVREFVFQLGPNSASATNATIRIKYSAQAKFTGGSPSAQIVPSATDERVIWGSGTDASFTPSTWFNTISAASYGGAQVGSNTVTGNVIFQGAAMDTAPYGFWFASMNQDSPKAKGGGILFDPVISAPEDTDPCVISIGVANFLSATGTASSTSLAKDGNTAGTWTTAFGGTTEGSWAHMDTGRTLFLYVQPGGYAANVGPNLLTGGQTITMAGPGGLTINPFNGKHEALPVAWMRASTAASAPGLKGWSTMARWATTSQINTSTPGGATVKNTFQETLDNKNWIVVGAFWLPWDGTSIALS